MCVNLIFMSVFFVCVSQGQELFKYDEQSEKEFVSALEEYKEGKYLEAGMSFEQIAFRQPFHQRTTASYVMAAKANIHLRNFVHAKTLLDTVQKKFPMTHYRDEVFFLHGITLAALGEHRDAVLELCNAAKSTQNEQLRNQIDSVIDAVGRRNLAAEDFRRLLKREVPERERELLHLLLGEYHLRQGNLVDARIVADSVLKKNPPSAYLERARLLSKRITEGMTIKIGVLLPLMQKGPKNFSKTLSEDILAGIQYAVREYQEWLPPNMHISLSVHDTERDSLKARKILDEIRFDNEVVAVIGPLYSGVASSCIPLAHESHLPMILPIATAYGLAEQSPYVFQAHSDVAVHGKALARFAVKELTLDTLAAIVPDDPEAKLFMQYFRDEAERLRATVLAEEFYADTEGTLSEQFLSLRKKISHKSHSIDIPLMLDGLVLPVTTPEQLSVVSSHVAFYNIKTQLLGSPEWNNLTELESQRRYTDGVIFTSESYIERDSSFIDFEHSFMQAMSRPLTKYVLHGYDCMNLLLSRIAGGASTRESLARALSATEGYRGRGMNISFNGSRVNASVFVLQYRHGEIRKIGSVNLNK